MNVHDFVGVLDICIFDLVSQKKEKVSRLQYYQNFQSVGGPTRMRIVTATPLFDEEGNIKYVITMLQDVQEFENLYHTLLAQHEILISKETKADESIDIISRSPDFLQLLSTAKSVAQLDSTVLLYGESGSGKEVVAHFIHDHSNRKKHPMVTVNCAAFPENLIESELFGYEKGSFTGANQGGKMGLVETADGGTLFLDEINSLTLVVQGKVLRVIEEKSVQRIGAVKSKAVNFRLITATNRDLGEMVRQGTFREDLYYRIHVIPLSIPPIRNRKEDIVPLCLHFLHDFCEKYHLHKNFSDEVLQAVCEYDWPGNVREIRNFVERMVVMTPYETEIIRNIPEGMLSGNVPGSGAERQPDSLNPYCPGLTREKVLAALTACHNHREKTAEYLGILRRYLQYKIKEYQIPSRCRRGKDTER